MQTAAAFFDERAPRWEAACYPPAVRERLTDLIESFGLTAGMRVLDMGTGTGVLLPYIQACIGPDGRICAFDLSLPMARQADQKRRWHRDLVVQSDAHHIPLGAALFHRVICFAAFPHFEDPASALAEMGRVTAPGGEVVIAHLLSREELAAHHASHQAVRSHGLPASEEMYTLMLAAGLVHCRIDDAPGRYLARGRKPGAPSD